LNWSSDIVRKKIGSAAASILARDGFVKGLAKLEKQFNMELAERRFHGGGRGGEEICGGAGRGQFTEDCQVHFRTAFRAQGLPEPPKREWRRDYAIELKVTITD